MQSNYICICVCTTAVCRAEQSRVRNVYANGYMDTDSRHCIIWIRFMKWDSLSLGIYLLDLVVISLFELRKEHFQCSPYYCRQFFTLTRKHIQTNNIMPPKAFTNNTHRTHLNKQNWNVYGIPASILWQTCYSLKLTLKCEILRKLHSQMVLHRSKPKNS